MRQRSRGQWAVAGLLAVAAIAACGATTSTLVNASLNTAIAGTAAGVRRAQGKCYTWCMEGTTCDRSSGLCVPLPCGGKCRAGERCVGTGRFEHCATALDGDTPPAPPPPDGGAAPERPPWLP